MNELEILLHKIKDFTDKKTTLSEDEMSKWIENFMLDNGQMISLAEEEIAQYINDRIVCEICEQTEPGLEGTNFRKEIEETYHQIVEMRSKHNRF